MAMEALKASIEDAIPGLHVHTRQQGPDRKVEFPCLTLLPRSFTFDPFQEDEVSSPTSDKALVDVGVFKGRVEMRLMVRNEGEQEEYEDALIDLFLSQEGRPGVLVAQTEPLLLRGVPTLHEAPVAFVLSDAEWNEEMVFDKQRFTYLDLDVVYPALVLREERYDITSLRLAFTEDLTSEDPTTEDVTVTEDGGVEP
jgi:hypothetical protein